MLPQVMKPFVTDDEAVEFQSRRPEQDPIAKLATAYVNYLFYTKNDGVGVMYDWFKDALIQKVGFVKVWAEEEFEDISSTYSGITQEQVVMLQQSGWEIDGEPQQEAPQAMTVDSTQQMGHPGQPIVIPQPQQPTLTVTLKKEDKRMAIKVAACAPHEVRIDANARWGDEPAMIAHVYPRRKFELEEEGYNLTNIGQSGNPVQYDSEVLAMLGENADYAAVEPHESHKLYQCAEVYIKLDADGDGIAEWLCCHMIEQTLVEYEKCDGHPFVWICPIPRPHAFFGDCPADMALNPQKLRTNIIRAIQDNLVLSVNQRTYINMDANVNMDDWLENRPGGAVRGHGPANTAIQPIVQPSLGAPAYEFNEWLDEWKAERTGFTKYSQGMDANSLNKTATGVSIITQKSDMRMELMSRMFAVGMKGLFAKMLKLAVQYQDKSEMIQINGEWVDINPSEWKDQFNVTVKVGLGTGSKEQLAARVMGLMQVQMEAANFGIITPSQIAETVKLYVQASEFKEPERFVSPEPSGMPPNPQAFQQMQQQQQQAFAQAKQQIEQLSQENGQLKQQTAQQQQDAALKQMEMITTARESEQKHQENVANIQLRASDQARKEHETHIRGVQTAHDMASTDIDQQQNAQIAQLQQQIAELQKATPGKQQGEGE